MLSYMVPNIEDKPPQVPVSKTRFQVDLENPRLTNGHAVVNGSDMLVTTPCLPSDTGERVRRLDASAKRQDPEPSTDSGDTPKDGGKVVVFGGKGVTVKGVVKSATLSTESSASSLSSGVGDLAPTHMDKPRPKLISNGGTKHQSLKRVSFGSSKGSMVETLIYESPVQEEPEVSPTPELPEYDAASQSETKQPSKVRVTFFQQERVLQVSSPEPELIEDLDVPFSAAMTAAASPATAAEHAYLRQTSTDSGWDNPFRPDGDLSREADEIVELIKGGKPITGTAGQAANESVVSADHTTTTITTTTTSTTASSPKGANGTSPAPVPATAASKGPGAVELQRATVSPSDASQVEHVVLKKKPKCKCCVIQ